MSAFQDKHLLYNKKFYANHTSESFKSAMAILSILYEIYQPAMVLDVGCGHGAWLAAAEQLGSKKMVGYDGPWIDRSDLISSGIEFRQANLASSFEIDGWFDLAISVEVAEHLPEVKAFRFVTALCRVSDVVIFGAAVNGQGGVNHINEQPQSYWIELFKRNGFQVIDIFRSAVWDNDEVTFWYRQNTFLFANLKNLNFDIEKLQIPKDTPYDIVHPLLLEHKNKQIHKMTDKPTLSFCFKTIKRYLRTKIRRPRCQNRNQGT